MKKKLILTLIVLSFLFCACVEQTTPVKIRIDAVQAKDSYKQQIAISPMDFVTITKHTITIAPHEENKTYTVSGYFNGQIMVKTKNTILKLDNAYLENTSGKAALRCTAKTEISSVGGTTNYIVSRGRGFAKNAALQGKRSLIIGGSGTLYVDGRICHAVEADNVKIKGSGTFYLQGTKRGSALTCESLEVESEKSFNAYLLNSRNGIKADGTISIASGNFYLYNNEVALKTEIDTGAGKKARAITLTGGTFHITGNGALYITAIGAFNAVGATFVNED